MPKMEASMAVDNPVSVDVTQTRTRGSEGAGNNDEV
jgi:hypothetical protein